MQAVDSRLVTPEAVVLEFETAGLGSRFLARILDVLLQLAAIIVVSFAAGGAASGGVGSTPLAIFVVAAVSPVLFVYPALFEAMWRGRTLGKAALGLRVVTTEGAPVRFRHAAIRSALFVVDGLLIGPVIGVLCLLLSRDNQRLGDIVAGTIVVRERTGARAPTPVFFVTPVGHEAYVASLDTTGLTMQEYETVRAMLVHAPELPPDVRYRLASQIASHVARRMRHTPPPGIQPELFLACVAADFQTRSQPSSPLPPYLPPPPSYPPPSYPPPTGAGAWGAPPPSPPEPVRQPEPPAEGGGGFVAPS